MTLSSSSDVLTALQEGPDGDIVGIEESIWFDANGAAYNLANNADKWELAKDDSAMANASGGMLFIAARTRGEKSWLEERVIEVLAVPDQLVMAQQYLDVLNAWTSRPLLTVSARCPLREVPARRYSYSKSNLLPPMNGR